MQFRSKGKTDVQINIAPLVDVVFLLVIFFAVSTTFLETAGIELTLPTSSSTAERKPELLTVWLAESGEIEVAGEMVTIEDLEATLRSELEGRNEKRVVLRADRKTEHGAVVQVMDAARAAGAEALTVAARDGEGG